MARTGVRVPQTGIDWDGRATTEQDVTFYVIYTDRSDPVMVRVLIRENDRGPVIAGDFATRWNNKVPPADRIRHAAGYGAVVFRNQMAKIEVQDRDGRWEITEEGLDLSSGVRVTRFELP